MAIFSYAPIKYLIGEISLEIDDEIILNEYGARKIGKLDFKKLNINCSVEVRSPEGDYIPHFHIESLDKDVRFSCCIQIFKNQYFTHGAHKNIISSKNDRKILNDWLEKINGSGVSNWQAIVNAWNFGNGSSYLNNDEELSIEKPDYTTILPYKEK